MMEAWVIAIIGMGVGIGLSKGLDAIGWFFKRGEQERRDAAHIAKIIYEDTKKETEAEVDKEIGKLVTRYGRIFRKAKKEWKVKSEC